MQNFLASLRTPGSCRFGTWVKIPALETVELLAHAGFDFIVIDMEHAPLTFESAYRAIVVAQGLGMAALVRLPDQNNNDVQRILDSGADGLLVPRVRSADEARRAMDSMLFSPRGSRGLGITSRAGRWGLLPTPAYVEHGDQRIVRAIQLEDREALLDAERILAVDGVNAAFIGLGDLALSTGLPAGHADNQALVDTLLAAGRRHGIPCGTAAGTAEAARQFAERGFSFVMVSNDATLFGRAAQDLVKTLRG